MLISPTELDAFTIFDVRVSKACHSEGEVFATEESLARCFAALSMTINKLINSSGLININQFGELNGFKSTRPTHC